MSRHTDEASPNEELESYRGVDIGASFPHIPSKEMSDGVSVSRHNELNNSFHHLDSAHLDSAHLDDQPFQQQILQLKKQQQLQQQILLQHFQQQQQQLAEQHEQQLRQHLKEFWEQQRALEEQRERREREKLEALKRKEKHEQSAVASHEVKLRLQGFLLGKKQRETSAAAASNGTSPQHAFRPWPAVMSRGGGEGAAAGGVGGEAGPLYHPLLSAYDDDFPLRKTASEPNLLKVRLKQRVIERRANPIARRKDRPSNQRRRPAQLPNSVCSGESGSPPANAPIAEECEAGSMADLSALYTSPSMPNISLGRPRPPLSQTEKLAVVSEAEVRAAFTARLGMPLTGQMLPGTLPFYPSLPAIDGESSESSVSAMSSMSSISSSTAQLRHMQSLEAAGNRVRITDSQVARARLHKQGHRPLVAIGRTQSAPLPLGRAAASLEEHQAQRTHSLLKQQIRQTVLTRTRNSQLDLHLQPAEPKTEDAAQAEVIDLTDRRVDRTDDRERQHFLQQQRDLMMRNAMASNAMAANAMAANAMSTNAIAAAAELFSARAHAARPLSRALSSPLVALSETSASQQQQQQQGLHRPTTGLAFDSLMLKHGCVCGDNSGHPEHGGRLQSVWARLLETGLVSRCDRIRSRKATLEEIQACHSEAHALLFGTNPLNRQKLDMSKLAQLPVKSFVRLPCGGVGVDSDTTWNELHTAPAARLAVGCVVDLAFKTALGDIRNGFAVVRPPGHHAEQSQAMGFCFFNSVAIAARLLQQRLAINKILIVDWDVHHGNGTQQAFYSDPRVLYLSLHRHDDGNFFPGTGAPGEVGSGPGRGANVNVAWGGGLDPPMGDAEYMAAFRAVVMPIAHAFAPEIVLVSCGFDAASGHAPPLGGYNVSPACFGFMTQQLLTLADGKVVLSLEGGYDLPSTCDSAQECVRALLGDAPTPVRDSELTRPPNANAVATLRHTLSVQTEHWPCLAGSAALVAAAARAGDEDAVVAMAGLSMQQGSGAAAAAGAAAGGQELGSSTEHSRSESEEPMEQEEEK